MARAYRVNRYVRGEKSDAEAVEALAGLRRFPAWMWRNTAVVEFIEWLRAYNDELDVSIRGMNSLGDCCFRARVCARHNRKRHDVEEVIEMGTPVFTESAQSGLLADIYESPGGDAYTIEIPIPGLKPDEIVLEADTYSLTVSTEPTQTEPKSGRRYIQREHSVRPMSRIFNFPVEIDTDNVQANLTNGMLQIRIPKAAAGKRKIIRVGQAA